MPPEIQIEMFYLRTPRAHEMSKSRRFSANCFMPDLPCQQYWMLKSFILSPKVISWMHHFRGSKIAFILKPSPTSPYSDLSSHLGAAGETAHCTFDCGLQLDSINDPVPSASFDLANC